MTAAGAQTIPEPSTGMMDSTAITVDQNAAPGRLRAKKAEPASPPWMRPTRMEPLMVARVTETNCSTSLRSSSSFRGV